MRRLSIKGVVVGGIVDITASTLLGFLVSIIIVITFRDPHLSAAQNHMIIANTRELVQWLFVLIGVFCSVLGGYIAARIAKHDEQLNGACSSTLCLLLGLFFYLRHLSPYPLWGHILLSFVSVSSSLVGGWLSFLLSRSRVLV